MLFTFLFFIAPTGKLADFHITVFDPADFAQTPIEQKTQNGGQDKVHQNHLEPNFGSAAHRSKRAELANQSAGAHTGAGGGIGHSKQAGGNGTQHCRGQCGCNPDLRMAHNIGKLQHRSTDALADQTAPAVFPEAGYGKAHHLTAAAHDCRAGGQPVEIQHNT